ncbi:MAG: diaminopimelate decarboxylase, partial [Cellulomonas sp.]|nr:diaminopimelate decarboxylase [Cellulomonas sp.]
MNARGVLGSPWSASVERGDDGALRVGGADVRQLAEEYGTPAYILDELDLRARARVLRLVFQAAFAEIGTGVDVYYA